MWILQRIDDGAACLYIKSSPSSIVKTSSGGWPLRSLDCLDLDDDAGIDSCHMCNASR